MTQRDNAVTLQQMVDYVRETIALTAEKTRADLGSDRLLELALTRLLEMTGEAAGRLPDELRSRYPAVPWRQMIGLRNLLIHGYDSVDLDILWQIVSVDLPAPEPELEAAPEAE